MHFGTHCAALRSTVGVFHEPSLAIGYGRFNEAKDEKMDTSFAKLIKLANGERLKNQARSTRFCEALFVGRQQPKRIDRGRRHKFAQVEESRYVEFVISDFSIQHRALRANVRGASTRMCIDAVYKYQI